VDGAYAPNQHGHGKYFPTIESLNYDNYLVAVNQILDIELSFTLSDGATCGTRGSKETTGDVLM
jgi:hypothetical protein